MSQQISRKEEKNMNKKLKQDKNMKILNQNNYEDQKKNLLTNI